LDENIVDKIKLILFKEGTKYIIFGVLTTVINIISYFILNSIGIKYIISNTIAFILSVLFAFITNKIYVFDSKIWETKILIKECITFLFSRLASFFIDMILLMILIEMMNTNEFIAKCIVNIVVIIVNYLLSKFIVFNNQ
jgi:putative flippase GtrA